MIQEGGEEEGGLNREGELIKFPPLKRPRLIRNGGTEKSIYVKSNKEVF